MQSYSMPYGVYEDSVYSKTSSNSPITPMETFQGDDYLGGSHYMYPTPQSLPRAPQHSNPHSPALFASRGQMWNLLPTSAGVSYSASNTSLHSSPMTCAPLPAQTSLDLWPVTLDQSSNVTPDNEAAGFDFGDFSTRPLRRTYTGTLLPTTNSFDFVDPSSIQSAPPQTLISNVGGHMTSFGTSPYSHVPTSSSFAYHSNQYQRSRSRSPGHSPSWQRGSPHGSARSMTSGNRSRQSENEEESKVRNRCPYPDCGKMYKDLKAHMLTHQDERPEKCPIKTCEFHKRGFARKYDRNRHLVTTHYKATIVCGFCPGSGSSSEKTFNRTDVFKRHLLSVHNVEQNPSKGKKSPTLSMHSSMAGTNGATGRCSSCNNVFANAQELFNHLDDCVLRIVQETNPIEDNNERLLSTITTDDNDLRQTFERNQVSLDTSNFNMHAASDDEDVEEVERQSHSVHSSYPGRGAMPLKSASPPTLRSNILDGRVSKLPRPTWGRTSTGTMLPTLSRKRKDFPSQWGIPAADLNLKKRVLCVFDGSRRLWKDEMTLNQEYEVRMGLEDGQTYITDLDVETLRRAEQIAGASEQERAMWASPGMGAMGMNGYDAQGLMA